MIAPFDDSLLSMLTAAAVHGLGHVPSLGPDMYALLSPYGNAAFWIVVAIIFAECGILIGFFLPGDSLLFITGMLMASGIITVNIWVGLAILFVAAVLGNITGYWVGHKAGPALFRKPDSKLFKQEYVDKTHEFFERYGARAIILARFVPIVRTFITAVAGIGRMDYRKYLTFSVVGAFLWIVLMTVAGYFLGSFTFVKNNIEIMAIIIVLISVVPIVNEYLKHRRAQTAE